MSLGSPFHFQVWVPGKWVLTGEHAVLRGAPALVFPFVERRLRFSFQAGEGFHFSSDLLEGLLRDKLFPRLQQVDPQWVPPSGSYAWEPQIPVAGGLGSSAALCVAVARWFFAQKGLSEDSEGVLSLATELEHLFHGKSSGMDVAVVFFQVPLWFRRGEKVQPLKFRRFPRFQFHDTGLRGRTAQCIQQVEAIKATPEIDQSMAQASQEALEALQKYQQDALVKPALDQLAKAMTQAQACFEAWGLAPPELHSQKERLLSEGALAVKLTGAGGGGFWVSLWPS